MPQSITSSYTGSSSSSSSSRSRSSSISSSCSSSSFSSAYSSSSSYSLSSYGSTFRSLSDYSDTSSSSSSITSPYHHRHTRATEPVSTLFSGLSFFFDKEAFKSLNEKQRLVSLVKDHSGSVSLMLSKKTTHFIVDRPTSLLLSLADNPSTLTHSLLYQINNAIRLNVHIASLDFVFASIQQLTLANQHATKFTQSIVVLAPEIPLLAIDPHEPEPSPEPEPTLALLAEEMEILAIEVETDVEVVATTPEPQPFGSVAYAPFVFTTPPSSTFEPTLILEKDTHCFLMSHVPPMSQVSVAREYGPDPEYSNSNITSPDYLSYSFEESRYYSAVVGGGKEQCLGQPVRETNMLGSVWSWGKSSNGQLGVGSKQTARTPAFVPTDFISTVAQVACGDTHTAVVTAQGDVWTWGFGASGCLGQGEFRGSKEPILVDYFSDIRINMVACGRAHTAVLTDIGTIWTWGRNHVGQLGYGGEDKSSLPTEVCEIKDAVFVACGGHNTAALTKYGHMYTMGCNTHGQRGLGKRVKSLPSPTRIDFPEEALIKYASIGQGFMGALDMSGQLYMWGKNLDYQCGLGHTNELSSPSKVSSSSVITHFACGDTHAAYVTEKGLVFTWGWGPVGQLGHPAPTAICTTPQVVQGVHDARMVSCGYRHTVAITGERCKLWVWGANEAGQLGLPVFHSFDDEYEDDSDYEDVDEGRDGESGENAFSWLSPQILESMSRVSMMACGKEYTVAIIEESYVPIQFAKDGNDEALSYWLENSPNMRNLDEALLKVELCNIRDNELGTDYSLLHWATYYAKESVLDLLAGQYMDPNITDMSGDTPLHICAERDIPSCVQILLQTGGKPDLKNKMGKTPIHISVENHSTEVLQEFIENSISDKSVVDEIGNTPLHYAIKLRHFDMAKYLIESAAQPQILDKSGKTALDYCSFKEASYFKSIAQKNDVFISYAHVDLDFALKIKEFLESYSIKCWMDMTRLEAGSDWRLDIGNGVLSSRMILYVGSRASVVSDWCIKELHMARKHNLVIIPVWFQRVEFDSEVKSLIFGRAFLDFSDPNRFTTVGKRLSKKLKYLLGIIKQSRHNPYLEIPVLTTEQLWKQLFLTVLIDSHTSIDAAATLDRTLHSSAIFSCTHNLFLAESSPYFAQRQANLDRTWGIVFLIDNLKQAGSEIEKWWKFAEDNGKHVYLCMVRGDATRVNSDDLPEQALKQTSVPIFYLENITSLQQLVFFVHLAQREEFMAKQVRVMQTKLFDATTTISDNDQELQALRKRFYVE